MRFIVVLIFASLGIICNVAKEDKVTFVKVCRYSKDSTLQCQTYFFTQADSLLYGKNAYIGVMPDSVKIRQFKKDTLMLIL